MAEIRKPLELTKLESLALEQMLISILDGDGTSIVMEAAKRILKKLRRGN